MVAGYVPPGCIGCMPPGGPLGWAVDEPDDIDMTDATIGPMTGRSGFTQPDTPVPPTSDMIVVSESHIDVSDDDDFFVTVFFFFATRGPPAEVYRQERAAQHRLRPSR